MQQSPYKCPRCQVPLTVFQAKQVTLHVCSNCGGAWLGKGQDRLIPETYQKDAVDIADRVAQGARARVDVRQPIACPVCFRQMRVFRVDPGGVDVDHCDQHGTWFDANEIKLITEAAAAARRQKFQQSAASPPKSASSVVRKEVSRAARDWGDDAAETLGGVAVGVFFELIGSLFD